MTKIIYACFGNTRSSLLEGLTRGYSRRRGFTPELSSGGTPEIVAKSIERAGTDLLDEKLLDLYGQGDQDLRDALEEVRQRRLITPEDLTKGKVLAVDWYIIKEKLSKIAPVDTAETILSFLGNLDPVVKAKMDARNLDYVGRDELDDTSVCAMRFEEPDNKPYLFEPFLTDTKLVERSDQAELQEKEDLHYIADRMAHTLKRLRE